MATTRAHVEGCPKALSIPVDLCECGGRDVVWPPNRVWLPDGVVALAAVSPELENVEGAWWIRETSESSTSLRKKIEDKRDEWQREWDATIWMPRMKFWYC